MCCHLVRYRKLSLNLSYSWTHVAVQKRSHAFCILLISTPPPPHSFVIADFNNIQPSPLYFNYVFVALTSPPPKKNTIYKILWLRSGYLGLGITKAISQFIIINKDI